MQAPVTEIGKDSAEPFPMIDGSWDTFASKGIRTVFLSVGASKSVAADLDIAEGLGCPINYVALNDREAAAWNEVGEILKQRKREESASPFSIGAESKWVLQKNVRAQPLPWWGTGTLDISGSPQKTQDVAELLGSICTTMKVKEAGARLDILKVDTVAAAPGLEKAIVGAVLNAGFRPAIVLVHWTDSPNVVLSSTVAAGNLQNCGYRLMAKTNNKFLYYFTDNDLYQFCSWEETNCQNPLLNEIAAASMAKMSAETREESNDASPSD
jgi:hypothetical protein